MRKPQTAGGHQFKRLISAHTHEALRDRQSIVTMLMLFGTMVAGLTLLDLLIASPTTSRSTSSLMGSGVLVSSLPLIALIGFSSLGLVNTAVPLAAYRAAGVLRQMGTTPISRLTFLLAHLPIRLGLGFVQITLLLVLTGLFANHSPLALLRVAALLLCGLLMLLSFGYLFGSLLPSRERAQQFAFIATIVLITTSGSAIPLAQLPGTLSAAFSYFPTTLFIQGLQEEIAGELNGIRFIEVVLIVIVTAAVLFALSVRIFRWDVREKSGDTIDVVR